MWTSADKIGPNCSFKAVFRPDFALLLPTDRDHEPIVNFATSEHSLVSIRESIVSESLSST